MSSQLRSVAAQVSAAIRDYGYLVVRAFPGVDTAVAASIVFSVLARERAEVIVYLDPVAPGRLEEPTLLLGYPALLGEVVEARAPSALIGFGERPQGLTRVPVAATTESSVAAMAAAMLGEITIVGDAAVYALAAAYWAGRDRGKKGEFTGVEAQLVEFLEMEKKVSGSLVLRLYRWFSLPVEESLEITLDPLLLGISGRRSEAEALLRGDPRLAPLLGKSIVEAPQEALATLATKLYEHLKNTSLAPRRPSEIIGFSYRSHVSPIEDLREAGLLAAVAGELLGGAALVSLALAPRRVYAWTHYAHYGRGVLEAIVEAVEGAARDGRRLEARRAGRLKIVSIEVGDAPLAPVVKQLRLLGRLPEDAVVASGEGEVLLEQVRDTLGYEQLRQLVLDGCIAYEPPGLRGVLVESKC